MNAYAFRLALMLRSKALDYTPDEPRHYIAQLKTYQIMPDEELFSIKEVSLIPSVDVIVSQPGVRVVCVCCGEEIINEREIYMDGRP